jgi:hypothetical protein
MNELPVFQIAQTARTIISIEKAAESSVFINAIKWVLVGCRIHPGQIYFQHSFANLQWKKRWSLVFNT